MPINPNDWYGGSEPAVVLNDDSFVVNLRYRTVILFPNGAARAITLPDPADVDTVFGVGRQTFRLANSGSFAVTVKDHEAATVGTIPAKLTGPDRWHWAYLHSILLTPTTWGFQLKTPP